MNWDDLRVFLAAARSRTLTTAAKQLGVNQTTVTRRLQSLQEKLGVRLFDRSSDGYAITEAGKTVLQIAEGMEDAVAALDRQVLGQDAQLSGPLRITTIDWMASLDTELFDSFIRRYPGIELELLVSDLPRNLTKREADIAIRWTNDPPDHLVGRPLTRMEFALYGARKLVQELPKNAELSDYPWLGWDEGNDARLIKNWMRKHIPTARIVCRIDSALTMFAALKTGMGVTFVPCVYGDSDPALCRLRPVEADFSMDVWLLTHPDLRSSARVRAFFEHTVAYFERPHSNGENSRLSPF